MPGHVFEALEDAVQFLRCEARQESMTMAIFPDLVKAANAENPNLQAALVLSEIEDEISQVISGKTQAEIEWEQWQALKRMPGIRVNPKPGVGNG